MQGDMEFCDWRNAAYQAKFYNIHDPYVIAVVASNGSIVGHLSCHISVACSFYLEGGTIVCQVTGRKCPFYDLFQGGLEIPCSYTFS